MKWLEQYVKSVPYRKGLYFFMKLFLFKFKGLTYKELYVILKNLYNQNNDEEESKKKAFKETMFIYFYNNKTLPNY